ncbi:MAG TPA: c-type cytochrome biogenesis protein CcmI [Burkholderiales bacterium]|nr:c-type cytochrome biogenesis protein CcmI [Burkholderiales bacterium]
MVVFLSIAGLLLIATVAILVYPLLARRARGDTSRNALNASLYAEQLGDLEADLKSGALAPTEYEAARTELKARLLAEAGESETPASMDRGRSAAIALAFAVPVLAIAVYLAVGAPQAIFPPQAAERAHDLTPQQVEAMVQKLAERLKAEPGNVEGWMLLGRSYAAFGRFKEAADAYAQAAKLQPGDAQLLADYADALGMAQGRSLAGEPEKLIARALEADPRHLKALALAGTAAYDRKDYKAAAGFWERMLPLVDANSEDARSIRANVEEARALAEGRTPQKPPAEALATAPPITAPPITTPPAAIAVAKGALNGEVRLAPALAAKASPDDTVFIFARAAQGPPMPLAVLRKKVRDLPASFALDDSMSMTPETKLSSFDKVVISARISKSGDVKAKPGDLQGQSGPVASDAAGVSVVIDSVVP